MPDRLASLTDDQRAEFDKRRAEAHLGDPITAEEAAETLIGSTILFNMAVARLGRTLLETFSGWVKVRRG